MPAWWKAASGPSYCYTCDTPNKPGYGWRKVWECYFCGGHAFYRDSERAAREEGRELRNAPGRKGQNHKRQVRPWQPLTWEEHLS